MRSEKKIGFYFDSSKTADWNWKDFRMGNIGMNGTDNQFLLLADEMSTLFTVFLFVNLTQDLHEDLITIPVADLENAVIKAKELGIDLLIFNNKNDDSTKKGILKSESLHQPFVLWDQNGPAPDFDHLLASCIYLKRIVCVSQNQANNHRHKSFSQR